SGYLNGLIFRQILNLINNGSIKHRDLEAKLGNNYLRAVHLRRYYLCSNANVVLSNLPYNNYDYSIVTCCENVIGYVPIPVGFAGPLNVNGENYMIPLATTEGAFDVSFFVILNGIRVISKVYDDGMTRAPVLSFKTIMEALELKEWLEHPKHFQIGFFSYCRLKNLTVTLYSTMLYLRFNATTGDAMGMNMVSKGVNEVLHMLAKRFSNMEVLSVSGNYCVDKKASAINWINGRGKSVIAEAFIPHTVVRSVLKTTVKSLCALADAKLLIGSSMSGTVGGWNAHAANIVAAMFLATGQDAAQVVSSSMCLTSMTETAGGDLHMTCTMRCLEVGTVGGGTILPPQRTCLKMLNCEGSCTECPGNNSKRLAEIICAAVLAGELSLMAALCTDDLVKNHLKYNRYVLYLTLVKFVYSLINLNTDKLGENTLECSAIL
uniref:3-hydroxy-3-methylglutaryl-coenzyme A reductase n=1 Tax=Syphacia muris TaxID=451379 RepID=A0A0N5B0A9_9BILA